MGWLHLYFDADGISPTGGESPLGRPMPKEEVEVRVVRSTGGKGSPGGVNQRLARSEQGEPSSPQTAGPWKGNVRGVVWLRGAFFFFFFLHQ